MQCLAAVNLAGYTYGAVEYGGECTLLKPCRLRLRPPADCFPFSSVPLLSSSLSLPSHPQLRSASPHVQAGVRTRFVATLTSSRPRPATCVATTFAQFSLSPSSWLSSVDLALPSQAADSTCGGVNALDVYKLRRIPSSAVLSVVAPSTVSSVAAAASTAASSSTVEAPTSSVVPTSTSDAVAASSTSPVQAVVVDTCPSSQAGGTCAGPPDWMATASSDETCCVRLLLITLPPFPSTSTST